MVKFSVIMPSYLGKYRYSASDPERKILRAIDSVLIQDDFELVIVADGCDRTVEIVKDNYSDSRIKLFNLAEKRNIPKNKRNAGASGVPRNAGIQQSRGEYIIYLDIDDYYREDYLKDLKKEMTDHDWYWFDNLSWNKKLGQADKYTADIDVQGQCGTANLCHKRDIGAWWSDKVHYLHDWMFISSLKASSDNYKKLETNGYIVCHVPHLLDV